MKTQKLALHGGTPTRTTPFPSRAPFGEEEINMVTKAIRSQNLFGLGGPMVLELEKRFTELYKTKYAVASSSGTAALHLAIAAINPNPGDEIITAPITDAGTIVPILFQGAIPVFADVNETYTMDPKDVERKITPRTKAILVVHLFGNACDMDAMVKIAKKHKLPLIEDCSQAHTTKYKDQFLGTYGDIGCFSLQQSKHMTAGEGGVTITNNENYQTRMSLFRDKGWKRAEPGKPRTYLLLGLNYRMTELQAAVAIVQCGKVQEVVRKRNELGKQLTKSIAGIRGVEAPVVTPGTEHSYWTFSFQVKGTTPEAFAEALVAEGVGVSPRYIAAPIFTCMDPLAERRTFGNSSFPLDGPQISRRIEYKEGLCPRAEQALSQMVTFWLHEHLTKEDIQDVANAIKKVAEALIPSTRPSKQAEEVCA
jgi:perosamine synthetase